MAIKEVILILTFKTETGMCSSQDFPKRDIQCSKVKNTVVLDIHVSDAGINSTGPSQEGKRRQTTITPRQI